MGFRHVIVGWGVAAGLAGAFAAGCGSGSSGDEAAGGSRPFDGGDAADVSFDQGYNPFDGSQPVEDASEAAVDVAVEPDADFCTGQGPLVEVGDTATSYTTCAGQIAASIFQNAFCTCGNATFGGYLHSQGFDSGVHEGGTGNVAAPVGIGGAYLSGGYTNVEGAFAITGTAPTVFAGYLKTADDLRAKSNLTLVGVSEVRGDGWLEGTLASVGPVTFDGDLHHSQPGSFPWIWATPLDVKGSDSKQAVTVTPACDCDPSHLLDVAKIVQHAQQNNDNATIGLSPGDMSIAVGLDVQRTLPCGRFYLSSINVLGKLTVHITGRVALFVDGDINNLGVLDFDVPAGTELDVFARGTMNLVGRASFGDKAHPASTRIYLGSSADVTLVGYDTFVGNLYAPKARVDMPGYIDLYGSLFAREYLSGSYTNLHYDTAIQHAGDDCPDPPPSCTHCGVCAGGKACVNDQCGTCAVDADCCGLMHCNNGVCENIIR